MATQKVTPIHDPRMHTMKAEEFRPNMPLVQLRESDLNPRKHYNQYKLEELAESIRTRGIITPLLARPVKGGMHEIAAGHRRFRAAQLAGLQWAPVRIMDLDDDAFLEVVSIENLQREDIHPLEEGDGFRELLKRNGYDVATLADKIGKPQPYVRGRLELADLVPVVRESFLQDAITIGHARLISRLDPAKQEDALRSCFQTWGDRTLIPVKDFRRQLLHNQGADLSKAPFSLDDVTLKRDAGACATCPKCTGVQRSLLADDTGEQTCLDRGCYDRKVQAHVAALTASGFVQISHAHKPPQGAIGFNDYVEAVPPTDEIEDIKAQIESVSEDLNVSLTPQEIMKLDSELKQLYAELKELESQTGECPHMEKGVYVDGVHQLGNTLNICRNADCPVHGKDLSNALDIQQRQAKADKGHDKWEIERQQKEAERKLNAKARKRAWEALLSAMGPTPKVDRFFLQVVAQGLYHRFNEDFCKAFGIEWEKGDQEREKGRAWTETATDSQLIRAILAAAFWEPGLQEYFDPNYSGKEIWRSFCTGLAKFGTSFEKIEKQVKAEMAEQSKVKSTKKSTAKPAAKKKASKPTASKSSKMAAAGDDDDYEEGEE
jgi:ParB/RepB/Spo0J family partition protein